MKGINFSLFRQATWKKPRFFPEEQACLKTKDEVSLDLVQQVSIASNLNLPNKLSWPGGSEMLSARLTNKINFLFLFSFFFFFCFDNYCYHPQCIAKELQWCCCRFLLVIQEKSAVSWLLLFKATARNKLELEDDLRSALSTISLILGSC